MEMTISLPTTATAPVKTSTKSTVDKTASSPFGEILGLTLENVPIPKEKTPTVDGSVPQAVLSAMFALLQPSITNVQTAPSTVMKNAVETPQITSGNLTCLVEAKDAEFIPNMNTNVESDATVPVKLTTVPVKLTTAPVILIPGQPLLADVGTAQSAATNQTQIPPDLISVSQTPALANLLGIDADVQSINDLTAYTKIKDLHVRPDHGMLTLLSTPIPTQLNQKAAVTPLSTANLDTPSTHEDRATATHGLQSNNKSTLVLTPKSTEEWNFNGSDHHGEQNPLNETAFIKNETIVSNGLFQAIMEKQSSAKPFVVSSSQPQQQTILTDNYDVASQIVEHAKLISRPQNTEMIIKLKPEHLGELTFKVAAEQGVMIATFHSANPEVRNIIEASLPQLKQDLSNQGIKLDNVGVFAGMDQFLSGDHRGGQQYQQPEIQLSRKHDADFAETVTEVLNQGKSATGDGGVDYRV